MTCCPTCNKTIGYACGCGAFNVNRNLKPETPAPRALVETQRALGLDPVYATFRVAGPIDTTDEARLRVEVRRLREAYDLSRTELAELRAAVRVVIAHDLEEPTGPEWEERMREAWVAMMRLVPATTREKP